ncbi:MAG: type II toxin-antitoxin system prevent-host-death family antitoxin [Eggerthellaceae bacterium]|nr:type II toxin-antitoxin system prevent-host-death family antitoxin [Eggerthellaceae bacterium]
MRIQQKMIPSIRPITDLRTQLNDVLAQTSETLEPIILTKNGTASCAIMSTECLKGLDARHSHMRAALKLREGEIDSLHREYFYEACEVVSRMQEIIGSFGESKDLLNAFPKAPSRLGESDVALSARATEDLEGIAAYFSDEIGDIGQAALFAEKFISLLSSISDSPRKGRPFRNDDLDRAYREIELEDFSVYYTFESGMVTIWRVLDLQRNIDRLYSIESF